MNELSHTGIVITHPDYGVLTGVAMGLAFWSKLDCAGQDCAPVFESEQQARDFLGTWPKESAETVASASFTVVALEHRDDVAATMANCVRAGLPAWTVDGRPCYFTFRDDFSGAEMFAIGHDQAEALDHIRLQQSLINPTRLINATDFKVVDCLPVSDAYVARQQNEARMVAHAHHDTAADEPAVDDEAFSEAPR